mmetsp:Transcript_2336/g.4003  ORF Transcript_2336/g.4003 Transcript_2336/m.4003 type:complete len:165 (-) Transcript_2336:262-756(-)
MKRPDQYFEDSVDSAPLSLFQGTDCREDQFQFYSLHNQTNYLSQQGQQSSLGARSDAISDVFLFNPFCLYKVQPKKLKDMIEWSFDRQTLPDIQKAVDFLAYAKEMQKSYQEEHKEITRLKRKQNDSLTPAQFDEPISKCTNRMRRLQFDFIRQFESIRFVYKI